MRSWARGLSPAGVSADVPSVGGAPEVTVSGVGETSAAGEAESACAGTEAISLDILYSSDALNASAGEYERPGRKPIGGPLRVPCGTRVEAAATYRHPLECGKAPRGFAGRGREKQ